MIPPLRPPFVPPLSATSAPDTRLSLGIPSGNNTMPATSAPDTRLSLGIPSRNNTMPATTAPDTRLSLGVPSRNNTLPTTSAPDTWLSLGVPSGNNTMPDSSSAQSASTQAQLLPQANTASSSAAASARKRRLMLLQTSRATRPRTAVGTRQATPAIFPRSHDALRQQQQLHAIQSPIETEQDIARLASQRPSLSQIIDPAQLTAPVSAVRYGRITIDGPDVTPAGRHFYLEQQCGHACAQHAVNAMVGGPLVSLRDFAQYEANAQAPQETMPVPLEDIAADMLALGVHVETVEGTLKKLGIPMHSHAHRLVENDQGVPVLDSAQAHALDRLQTDRLLLQVDRYEGDSTTSHYVAFRRDGGQWVLLDSLLNAPRHGVTPSDYLLEDQKIKHFTAMWPQHALRGSTPAVDAGGSSTRAAQEDGDGAMREEVPEQPQEGGREERQTAIAVPDEPSRRAEAVAAQDPKAAKKQRLAEAKARLEAKKAAAKKESRKVKYGVSTEKERRALVAGFKTQEGKTDMTAYYQHIREQSARNYTDRAGNHPFVKANGEVDMSAYNRYINEQKARNFQDEAGNYPFRNADGSGNVAAYNRHIRKQKARSCTDEAGNHLFVKANGEVDMKAYYQYINEQQARSCTDEAGNHLFVKANGEVDMKAYYQYMNEQKARNFKDEAGNHPFRNADGSGNVTAYKRYMNEKTARNFKDEAGNHPFRNADGSGNVMAYSQHLTNQRARSYIKAAANHSLPVQETSGSKVQLPSEDVQIIGAYMLIAQLDGSHKKRSATTVATDEWNLKHFASWLRQNANVPHGLNSLEKLGRHRRDDEVENVLARFRQAPEVSPRAKSHIKAIVEVLRLIWHRIEKEKTGRSGS